MVEVAIENIGIDLMTYERVVTLKEKTASCYLPIYMGNSQAGVIKNEMEGLRTKAADDFLANQPAVKAKSIAIDRLENGIFYARASFLKQNKSLQVDCPTALAVAVALR